VSDSYTRVGYASGDIGAGRRPAVLVVDFQVAFTDPKYPLGGLPMIHAARDRTAELLQAARAQNVPIAACYTAYGSVADMPRWKVKAVRDEFFYEHPCTQMDEDPPRRTSPTARTRLRCSSRRR
jgi:maleamate amidohydrolase